LLYAAYGSNLHPVRLGERIATARLVGSARVAGWSLRFHKRSNVDGSGKCDIVPAAGAIHVAVFDIDSAARRRLDAIEGLGQGYDEARLPVPGFGDCMTYRAAATHVDASLQPLAWYRELVIRGCEYHGFPPEYVDRIRSVPAVADADAARRREMWAIAARLRLP